MPGVIIDDAELLQDSVLSPAQRWQIRTNQNGAFNRTLTVCDMASNGTGPGSSTAPSIDLSVYGTRISLVGRPTADLRMNYTVDGSSVRPAILNTSQSAIGKDGVVIWNLDLQTPTSHRVRILPVAGSLFLDYLSYVPSSGSPSIRDTVSVDDRDPQVKYSGTWTNSEDFSTPAGFPFNTTVSRTTTAGSSFRFNFTGSTLGVFGLQRPVAGTLSASYQIDNEAPEDRVHFNGSQSIEDRWSLSSPLYTKDLVPGSHMVTVTVKEVTGSQEFVFDYMTFEATSGTRFISPSPSTSPNGRDSTSSSGSRFNIGAIVGSIIAFMLVAYVVRWMCRRRTVYTPQPVSNNNNNQSYYLETTQVTTAYVPAYSGQQTYTGQQAYTGQANRQDSWQPPPPPYVPPAPQEGPLQPQGSGWQPPSAPPPMPSPQPWQPNTAGEVSIPEPAPAVWHQPHVDAQPQIGGSPPTGPAPPQSPPPPSLLPLMPQPPPPAASVLNAHAPPRSPPPPQAREAGPRSESPEFEEVPLEQLGLAPNPASNTTTRPNEPGGGPPPPSGNVPGPAAGGLSGGQDPGPRS
ncbi:hypothetical protein EST38_g6757 [Candolleomyces aberdarensis]|uniref:Uncharacterized protein n=1 Tax=Candolleomyces aberdarensis TaxID=2316362 RepID=A0A4Q2DGV2_9AGAR|nr:hypothetical protein EST38_g6757 [Candolleomyces aberdarensis]